MTVTWALAVCLACLASACDVNSHAITSDSGPPPPALDASTASPVSINTGGPDTGELPSSGCHAASGNCDAAPGDDAGDARLPANVLAVFVRATPTMSDCIEETPLGGWETFVVDVAWHMELDGHLTDVRLVHSRGYCSVGVVRRRLEGLRFPPQDRTYDGTYRFVFRKFI